jgi:hypothetical protein
MRVLPEKKLSWFRKRNYGMGEGKKIKREEVPTGIEPVTGRTAAECSTAELWHLCVKF